MPTIFFEATSRFGSNQSRLSGLTWASAAALWNMRAQVAGHLSLRPEASALELKQRFLIGVEYAPGREVSGVDLRRFFSDWTWDQDVLRLGEATLMNGIVIYEAWLHDVLKELHPRTSVEGRVKDLQFPSMVNRAGMRVKGDAALNEYELAASPTLQAAFGTSWTTMRENRRADFDSLLQLYRAYKEARNAVVHAGGVATPSVQAALADGAAVLASVDLDGLQIPIVDPNGLVMVSLYSSIGFLRLVRRLVVTIEAVLAQSDAAEAVLISRWRNKYGRRAAEPMHRRDSYYGNCIAGGLSMPRPATTAGIHTLLVRSDLVVE